MVNILNIYAMVILSIASVNSSFAQWEQGISGLTDPYINSLASLGQNLIAGTDNGIFVSTDNGMNWTASNTSTPTGTVYTILVNGTKMYAGTMAGIFTSKSNGADWIRINYDFDFVLALATDGTNLFVGTAYDTLFRSSDDGVSWIRVNSGITTRQIRCILIIGEYIFVSTYGGGVFRSNDEGDNWISVNSGLSSMDISSLVISGTSLFANAFGFIPGGAESAVFRSDDYGANWMAANKGLPEDYIPFLYAPLNSSMRDSSFIFAGTSSGVFISNNKGEYWIQLSSGLSSSVECLAASDSYLFAGTFGEGVWRLPVSKITSISSNEKEMPLGFALSQNYPNPFNSTTNISFSLPLKSFISLKIYDITGRDVSTLVSEELSAGNYSRIWNGTNSSSGVYIYQVRVGAFTETKKLILLK
jgi:ligand-binding sensor domain-containing protein